VWQPPIIAPLDPQIGAGIRALIDGKAKPPGSLGRIEDLALQLGMIRHPGEPRGDNAVLLVFAGDHGLVAEGVSQYPSAVTVAMVMTYMAGRATANAFATANNVDVRVIDIGVAAELPVHPRLIDTKVRMGTANAAREPARWASATPPPPRYWYIASRRHRWMIASASAPDRMMRAWRANARPSPRRQPAATQPKHCMC
jgi:nicotinate-nucleotide--dimethylbenzimidazole phosphoribosyltransferase